MTNLVPLPSAVTEALAADALRMLAADAVEAAQSGHPGMPMGMADIAVALWGVNGNGFLRHNPANPHWWNRDRFVLSNGHGSMLLYGLLHLTGYDLGIDDLRHFRQLHSRTPGHPEWGVTPGVETTTGPLGQGLANAVGMALAEKLLAEEFNRPGHTVVDHWTYVFLGDGCLMEGISHEACSLAGTLSLGKLVCLWDDNGISIDGEVDGWFGDDTPARFAAYGWQVIAEVDGHDARAVARAIAQAKADPSRPSLICCRTVIGKGSPGKAGTHEVHGAPLGAAELTALRQELNWPHPPFHIPDEIYRAFDFHERGLRLEEEWRQRMARYAAAHPDAAAQLHRRMAGDLPAQWAEAVRAIQGRAAARDTPIATRKASQEVIAALAAVLPELFGGSADLTGSNLTDWPGVPRVNDDGSGRYLSYGVREFAMAAIMNGMALHGGYLPFGGTFLVFSDYARNALRMAALMRQRVVAVLTHDSIGLGEDGPTHQPIEHAASLRLIPNLSVWRPCDAAETAAAWIDAVERRDGPTALLLSRQALPCADRSSQQIIDIRRGGYMLSADPLAKAVLIGTGSEVGLCLAAQEKLRAEGIPVSVVSMPCLELFLRQPSAYRDTVLPPGLPRLAVEAGHPDPWWKVVAGGGVIGPVARGDVIGIDTFGESGPAPDLFRHFGLTPDKVAQRLVQLVRG
ncbi:MAG: transketolase [Magnetospirillum sp.]|nr:transketolase [Magnetospirillum sp.]